MKTIIRNQANDLAKLHDELLAAIPALRPVPGARGLPQAVMLLEARGNRITLQVPDDVTETQVDAVLAVHDPTPRAERNPQAERIAALKAAGTQAQKIAALEALVLSLAGDQA